MLFARLTGQNPPFPVDGKRVWIGPFAPAGDDATLSVIVNSNR